MAIRHYEVWMGSDSGARLYLFDNYLDLEFVNRVNGSGYFLLTVPAGGFDSKLLRVDNMIQVWRTDYRGRPSLEFIGFLRRWKFVTSGGNTEIVLSGPDQNDLLDRRIVAYAAGSAGATISGAADDGIKNIFYINLGGGSSQEGRSIAQYNVTIAGDLADGPSIEKSFAWRKVSTVIKDIHEQTSTLGNEVFYNLALAGVDEDSVPSFVFTTYTGQPGADRTADSGDPVIFSLELGNLRDPVLDYDYSNEENFIYVGGQGEGNERAITYVWDDARIGASQWNRREGFKDARNVDNRGNLEDEGEMRLAEMRPRIRFSGKLLDTEQSPYGTWRLGDKVTVFYLGLQLDVIIRAVYFRISRNGAEDIMVNVEAVDLVSDLGTDVKEEEA
jgi:hypothetical protein